MIPALSSSSEERSVYTALGTFTGSIGYNGVTAIVVPVVAFFGGLAGAGSESQEGWTGFGAVIAILGIVTCLAVAFGTREEESVLRDPGDKSNPLQAFQAIGRNDQLLWVSLSYVLYSIANVATTGFMIYLFKFVLRLPDSYSVVGIIAFVIGLVVTPLYPAINRCVPRRYLYLGGMALMAIAYVLFILFSTNLTVVFIALVLFYLPATCIQMTAILTITDSVEYGQLKTGKRNEAVTLSVRPMLDKIAGALSNSIVGFVAIAAAMTNDVNPDLLTTANIETFKAAAFYAPLGVIVLAFFVFARKVTLSEKRHSDIVATLKANMAHAEAVED
jgi:glycoside/pentoside/hexuronide transporter